jgi:hypothetical protein
VKVAVVTEANCQEGEGTVVNWFLLALAAPARSATFLSSWPAEGRLQVRARRVPVLAVGLKLERVQEEA